MRSAGLSLVVVAGAVLVLGTELLSAIGWLTAGGVLCWWLAFSAAVCYCGRWPPRIPASESLSIALPAAVVFVLAITGITAVVAPPNTWDALAYHLPRVVFWAQQSSVEFFPATYQNQNGMPPMAEYAMLHTWLFSGLFGGSDRWVNLPQWIGLAGSALAASLIARRFGAAREGQWLAGLFAVSLPGAILQASGAKNDLVLALWLLAAYYFLSTWRDTGDARSLMLGALAAGLAVATKGTAYLFLPPLWLAACGWRSARAVLPSALAVALAVLLLNGAFYARNFRASGSPLGFDSAHGDGRYRWRNEAPGLRTTLSNVLRHASEQAGGASDSWNQGVYRTVLNLHAALGLDPSDPASTWRDAAYAPPKSTRHEAGAGNGWHLLVLLACVPALCRRGVSREALWLMAAAGAGFLLFSVALRWQPFQSRLLTPLFLLAAAPAALVLEGLWLRLPVRARAVAPLVLLFLLRGQLFGNWLRPWTGEASIWRQPRQEQYFADIRAWGSARETRPAIEALAASKCRVVGVDSRRFEPEYPYLALLSQAAPSVKFVRLGLGERPIPEPCAAICLGCPASEAGPGAIQMGRSTFTLRRN